MSVKTWIEHANFEPIGYDDRKDLASAFQDHCALPESGLSDEFYAAVIEVANIGYERAKEHAICATEFVNGINRLGVKA